MSTKLQQWRRDHSCIDLSTTDMFTFEKLTQILYAENKQPFIDGNTGLKLPRKQYAMRPRKCNVIDEVPIDSNTKLNVWNSVVQSLQKRCLDTLDKLISTHKTRNNPNELNNKNPYDLNKQNDCKEQIVDPIILYHTGISNSFKHYLSVTFQIVVGEALEYDQINSLYNSVPVTCTFHWDKEDEVYQSTLTYPSGGPISILNSQFIKLRQGSAWETLKTEMTLLCQILHLQPEM